MRTPAVRYSSLTTRNTRWCPPTRSLCVRETLNINVLYCTVLYCTVLYCTWQGYELSLSRKPRTDKRRMGAQKDGKRWQRDGGNRIAEGLICPAAILLTFFWHPFDILLTSVCYPFAIDLLSVRGPIRDGFSMVWLQMFPPKVTQQVCKTFKRVKYHQWRDISRKALVTYSKSVRVNQRVSDCGMT